MENRKLISSPRLGFVGIGKMGHGLAKNAGKAGYETALLIRNDRDRERAADLLEKGAVACGSLHTLAAQAEIVILCVTGAPEVEATVLGAGGLLASLRPGSIIIDCSTSMPETTRRLAAAAEAQECAFMDAALTGTPKEAEEGVVNLLVGAEPALLEKVRPVLAGFARNIYHCGAAGSGHAIKLLHQFIVLGNAAILAEAFSFARSAGVSLEVMCDVIGTGGANSTAFQRFRPYILEGKDDLFRFSLANALKDMEYYTEMAHAGNAVAGLADAAKETYRKAGDAGLKEEFVPRLVQVLDHATKPGS